MAEVPVGMLYQGLSVDIEFGEPRPTFGDLFPICGQPHPKFPPSGHWSFERLEDVQFDQVDDYFGVRSLADDGTDVVVWLYPLVDGQAVYHHAGPFHGVQLHYSVLRNPARHVDHFLRCVEGFASIGARTVYNSRGVDLGSPPDLSILHEDIDAVIAYWASEGIVVGSDAALTMDY